MTLYEAKREIERLRLLVRDYAEALRAARAGEVPDPLLLARLDEARRRTPVELK